MNKENIPKRSSSHEIIIEEEEIKREEQKVLKTKSLLQTQKAPNLSGKKEKDNMLARPPWIPTK